MLILIIILLIIGIAVAIASAVHIKSQKSKLEKIRQEKDTGDRYSQESQERKVAAFKNEITFTKGILWVGIGIIILSLVLTAFQSFYRQDVGESKVQVSWTGELIGQSTTPGLHFKAPWVSVRTFDVRNNIVAYVGDESQDLPNYSGNKTTGPQITFQDREGVTGNLDLTLRYSLKPDSVLSIYKDFRTQEDFVNRVISEGVRAEARVAPSTRGTLEVYSDRAGLANAILINLEKRWEGLGIIIEDVAIQEIRYSNDVKARFDEAQAARIAVDKARADQEAATVVARTKVIEAQGVADSAVVNAQGQAEANDILTKSLSEEILTQRYIDALTNGSVFIVPEGSTPLITTGK